MGSGKKEAARRERQGKTNDGMGNVRVKGENFYRDAKRVKVLNRFKEGKPQRNAEGKVTKAASYQSKEVPKARIEPNRKWFTNSRVISQESLAAFRDAVAQQTSDPNSYLLKTNKLPMSLIRDDTERKNGVKQHKAKMVVQTASFGDTFGPKAQRKRPKLGSSTFGDLAGETVKMHGNYLERLEQAKLLSGDGSANIEEQDNDDFEDGSLTVARESVFSKGQSKRIWNELYKVIDSSDVILHVLDARDPLGTRCRAVEKYLAEEAPHKHLVFILNKCDLVPTGVAAAWVKTLSTEYPTLAFHASLTNSFGKGSLIALLRQFATLHANRKQISAGFIGYPNTGKSSIINTLRGKAVAKTAPIPGETKVWQYITLTRRIYMIDCPGIVPPSAGDSDADLLMRGVVRVENVGNPAQYVGAVLHKCQRKHVERTYGVREWDAADQFLEQLARKSGRLLKGGEPDVDAVARVVLNDFLRGRLPWFSALPVPEGGEQREKGEDEIGQREGRLGEMGRKRKRDEIEAMVKKGAQRIDNANHAAIDGAMENSGSENEGGEEELDSNVGNVSNLDSDSGPEDEFEGFADNLIVDPDAIGDLDGGDVDFGEDFSADMDDNLQSGSADDGSSVSLEESEHEEQSDDAADLKIITSRRSIDESLEPLGKSRRKP